MEQNLRPPNRNRICRRRTSPWIRRALAGLALTAIAAGIAQADVTTVSGEFTSFTSYIGLDRTSLVNANALTPSSVSVSASQFLSNTVYFAAGTTRLDFNYDFNFPPPAGHAWLVNTFQYTPTPQTNISLGQTFQFGTFGFTNGQWWPQADIGFRLTSHSSDPALDGHVFDGTLRLLSVSAPPPFPVDPYAEADFVSVVERPDLGSMRVFDLCCQPPGNPGNTGDFEFLGKIDSLILTGFEPLNGGGFTNPSVQPELATSKVPEPGSWTLFGTCLLAAAGAFARRTSAGARSGRDS